MELTEMVKGKKYQLHYKIPTQHRQTSRMMVGVYLGRVQPRTRDTLAFDLRPDKGTVEIEAAWIIEAAWVSKGTKSYYDVKVD